MMKRAVLLIAIASTAATTTGCGIKEAQLETLTAPEDPQSWVDLGDAYRRSRKKEQAKQAYNQALNLNPNHEAAQESLRQLNKNRKLTELEKLALENPYDDELWGDAGDEFMMMGMPERAASYFKKAHLLDPGDPEWRGRLIELGLADTVIDTMRAQVDRDPNNDEIWGDYGDVLRIAGWEEQACEAYREARSLDPADSEWQNALTNCPLSEEEQAEVEARALPADSEDIAEALGVEMESAELLAALGAIYADKGEQENALSYYRKALDKDPAHPDWQFQVSLLSGESLLNLLKDLKNEHLGDGDIWCQLGDQYVVLGRRDDAIEAYNQGLNLGADDEQCAERYERLTAE